MVSDRPVVRLDWDLPGVTTPIFNKKCERITVISLITIFISVLAPAVDFDNGLLNIEFQQQTIQQLRSVNKVFNY